MMSLRSVKLTPRPALLHLIGLGSKSCRCDDAELKRKILRDHFPNVAFPEAIAYETLLDTLLNANIMLRYFKH